MSRALGLIRLVHPFPVAVVVASTIALLFVAHRGSPGWAFTLRVFGVVLSSQVAVGALNDYVDREVDAKNRPEKPIPAGLVRPGIALGLTFLAMLLLFLLAASFGLVPLILVAVGTGAGLVYDLWLKTTWASFLAYVVAFLSLVTWIWLVAGHLTAWFLLVYPLGTLLLVAVHLANSLPDLRADRSSGQRGLAVTLGYRLSFLTIFLFYALVAAGALAISLLSRSVVGLAFVLLSFPLAIAALYLSRSMRTRRYSQQIIFRFVAPAAALLAIGSLYSIAQLS